MYETGGGTVISSLLHGHDGSRKSTPVDCISEDFDDKNLKDDNYEQEDFQTMMTWSRKDNHIQLVPSSLNAGNMA
jgi:hypothetical protein